MSYENRPLDGAGLAQVNEIINTRLSQKQDILTGTQGQVVGFDEDGNPIAQDLSSGGMTEAEADGKYLPLAGGKLTGDLSFKDAYGPINVSSIKFHDWPSGGGFTDPTGTTVSIRAKTGNVYVHKGTGLTNIAAADPAQPTHLVNRRTMESYVASQLEEAGVMSLSAQDEQQQLRADVDFLMAMEGIVL